MPTLQLKKLTTNSFQGINQDAPVIIDFSKYTGKKITKMSGDMGVGKTSTIHSLLYACGQSFDFKLENFVNLQDGALSGSFEFTSGNKEYKVTYSKTKFVLNRLYKDADEPESAGKWIPESDPKTLLKKLIGHIATSPMFLKEVKGEKQIEWLYEILSIPPEVKKQQDKLKEELTLLNKSFTNTNALYKEIKSALNQDEKYLNWEESEKTYSEEKSILSVKEKLDAADKKKQQYNNAVNGLDRIKTDLKQTERIISAIEQQISDLQVKLELDKSNKINLEEKVKNGEKYIEENKNVQTDYDEVLNDFQEINTFILNKNNWKEVVKKKNEMDDAENLVQELEVKKKDKKVELKSLVKKVLPEIKGMEVETDAAIEGREVGIYIDGKTPAQLSESELFDFYFQICMSQGVNMVFVENLSSFGSATIKTLNALAKKGVYVFGTMMDRKQKTLKIEILEEIE